MMTGTLTSDGEPVLQLTIEGPAGTQEIEALVDTGFNGGLMLSTESIAGRGLPEKTVMEVTLADGRVRDVQTYVGTVSFSGASKRISVAESPTTPLLGTDLLWDFSLLRRISGGRGRRGRLLVRGCGVSDPPHLFVAERDRAVAAAAITSPAARVAILGSAWRRGAVLPRADRWTLRRPVRSGHDRAITSRRAATTYIDVHHAIVWGGDEGGL
jgi:clan AA aspartic protease